MAIDAYGHPDWRQVDTVTTLSTDGATSWVLLDVALGSMDAGTGEADGMIAPTGGYLVVYGPAGKTVAITSR